MEEDNASRKRVGGREEVRRGGEGEGERERGEREGRGKRAGRRGGYKNTGHALMMWFWEHPYFSFSSVLSHNVLSFVGFGLLEVIYGI